MNNESLKKEQELRLLEKLLNLPDDEPFKELKKEVLGLLLVGEISGLHSLDVKVKVILPLSVLPESIEALSNSLSQRGGPSATLAIQLIIPTQSNLKQQNGSKQEAVGGNGPPAPENLDSYKKPDNICNCPAGTALGYRWSKMTHTYTCTVCGYVYPREFIPPYGAKVEG